MANQTSQPAPEVTDARSDETHQLIALNKVEGTAVYTKGGGGFLGIGERYHPLPWEALTYHPNFGGYVVNVERDHLENAPHYGPDENPWHDPKYGPAVYGYYGLRLHSDH